MSQEPEILFKNEVALARLMSLAPNEIGQRHYHSCVVETVVCTAGRMAFYAEGQQPIELSPGQQVVVSSPIPHHVANLGHEVAHYILLQAGGAYDFLVVK